MLEDASISVTSSRPSPSNSIVPAPLSTPHTPQDVLAVPPALELNKPVTPMEIETAEERGEEVPDGGLRAWLNVVGAGCVMFCIFGYASSFGVFQSWYQNEKYHGYSASSISWVGSVQSWLEFSFALITGPLFDRGHFRLLLTCGSILYVFSLFMTSLCTAFWQTVLAQAVGMGLGMGLLYIPAMSVLSQYFLKKRSLVMGLALAGSSVGGISFPILLNHLFPKLGFAPAVRVSAYIVLAVLLLANLLLSQRLPPSRRVKISAEERPSPIAIICELKFTLAVVSAFLVVLAVFFPVAYIQVFCELKGLPPNITNYALTIYNASSLFGRIIPNAVADKIGMLNTMTVCGACTTVLAFSMFGASSTGGLITASGVSLLRVDPFLMTDGKQFAILFGFFSGADVALLSPTFVALAKKPSEIGLRQGIAFSIIGMSALISTPISGALLAHYNNEFTGAIIFAGSVSFAGTVGLGVSRTMEAMDRGTWRV